MAVYVLDDTTVPTTLDGAINDSTLTVTLTDGSSYPAADFHILINAELIDVESRTGNVLTVRTGGRGAGEPNTTAASHSNLDEVVHAVSITDLPFRRTVGAATWEAQGGVNLSSNVLTGPLDPTVGTHVGDRDYNDARYAGIADAVPADSWLANLFTRPSDETAHAYDDEFDDATKDVDWTELTVTGTTTWTEKAGLLSARTVSQAANDFSPILKPLDSLSYPLTIETATIPGAMLSAAVPPTHLMFGLAFSDGVIGTSNCVITMPYLKSTGGDLTVSYRHGTFTNIATNYTANYTAHHSSGSRLYQRLIWSAANTFKFQWSWDDVNWFTDPAAGTGKTLTPTHFGLNVSTWAGTRAGSAAFDYFRVTEADLSV